MSLTFAKCNCTHFHSDKAGPYGNQPKTKTKFVLVTSPEVPKTKFVLVIRTENQHEFVFVFVLVNRRGPKPKNSKNENESVFVFVLEASRCESQEIRNT